MYLGFTPEKFSTPGKKNLPEINTPAPEVEALVNSPQESKVRHQSQWDFCLQRLTPQSPVHGAADRTSDPTQMWGLGSG